jgi:hypothetical protein
MPIRRRPLLRAGMLAGTAYVAHQAGEHSAERSAAESQQDERLADPESQPQPQAAAESSLVAELSKLKGMLDAGALNPQEFAAAKQKLLAG